MPTHPSLRTKSRCFPGGSAIPIGIVLLVLAFMRVGGAPATLLFEDDFNRGIPGWTAVQPAGNFLDGPMRWQYDVVEGAFLEQSNIYTDASGSSPSATAVMLINDAVAGTNFVYRARLVAGDDDAFGLIFGYKDANNFYRLTFTRQVRTEVGYPWNGWNVDRKVSNVATNLFGHGTPDHVESFVNTQYQPFDVTVTVSGANLLSVLVVDDPEGARTEYRLVENQPLPAAANGKVGFTTWGMSGTALRGFRILDPVLEPVPLISNPNALVAWTPVVTERADGSGLDAGSGNGGRPIWSLALGQTGAFGTLHENSDSFGGNDADGAIDFSAPSIVTGDTAWTDVVMTARVIPGDDDGHGILLRYRDARNFYRIALRSQASATGPRKGLSVQKVVEGTWEEVFREETVQYDPLPNVPYEITAVIIGNRLQIQLLADPSGARRLFHYGPFDLTGSTLGSGKVGLFGWGMSRTEFDWIRVYGIEGLPLVVSSPYGQPSPPVGLQGFAPGTEILAAVASPIEDAPGVRRVVTGWTGTGSAPESGAGSEVRFTLDRISSLTWNWRTEFRLVVGSDGGGKVDGPGGDWLTDGTNIVLTAQPDSGYVFAGWAGDLVSVDSVLRLSLTRPLTLTARFAVDGDGDGLPDGWEQRELGGLSSGPLDDLDGDGRTNLAEYRAGTDPRSSETVVAELALASRWENVQRDPALPGQLVVRDFGGGFRGVWENSNDYREAVDGRFIGAENTVPGVSFEGPRLMIRTNIWDPAWKDFTAHTVFSVGDNDGNCVYFRYRDERNWYRLTVCGENNNLDWRAPFGVTIQKRVNGVFSELVEDASIATDPTDLSFYKRVRVTVSARGQDFEVRVTGWNATVTPPEWDTGREWIHQFGDADHVEGRLGIGTWGQSGGGPATGSNPVNAGVLIEDVVVEVGGRVVFEEDWSGVPLASELPAGWEPAYGGAAAGTWQATAHASILQTANYSTTTSASSTQPRADGEGSILLGTPIPERNQWLEFAFHPFDDDGIGFVYDFQDTNNFARVLFVSEPSAAGRIPQGVNVSRKVGGVWRDVLVASPDFIYRNGVPFAVEFAHRDGEYRMTARDLDDPGRGGRWAWSDAPIGSDRRPGLAVWGETDAHFTHFRASSMPTRGPSGTGPRIAGVKFEAGELRLELADLAGQPYSVERTESLLAPVWSSVADGLTESTFRTVPPASQGTGFYRVRQSR